MRFFTSLLLLAIVVGLAGASAPAFIAAIGPRVSPEVVFAGPTTDRVIALTIDDGPSTATSKILEVLRAHDARATFFLIGEHLLRDTAAARAIVAQGSEVGHHMMTDESAIGLREDEFLSQFERMDSLLAGLRTSNLYRPGHGWYDADMVRQVRAHGYTLVLGSIYPFDAQIPFPAAASWYIRRWAVPGAIIILHDGPRRGLRTAETLRNVLPELKRMGFRITTVSELIAAGRRGRAAGDPVVPAL